MAYSRNLEDVTSYISAGGRGSRLQPILPNDPNTGIAKALLQAGEPSVYLDNSTVHNGATRLIPGSHTMPHVGVPQPKGRRHLDGRARGILGMADQAMQIGMERGSVLLFNGLAFHGVGANHSGARRASMMFGFRSIDELDAVLNEERQILVAGEYMYRGNDTEDQSLND